MPSVLQIAEVAALLGDPGRINMVLALSDGRALPAGELALAARIAPATASGHLGQLVAGGLLRVTAQGRYRYYRIASPEVATLMESVLVAAAARDEARSRPRRVPSRADAALREARTCYNHLAGRLGVALADALATAGHVRLDIEGSELTPQGMVFLTNFGLDLGGKRHKTFCRTCIDWSERRLHLSGHVGATLCRRCLDLGWIERRPASRAIDITPTGQVGFGTVFGFHTDSDRGEGGDGWRGGGGDAGAMV